MANETWPRAFCIVRKTIFSKFLLIFPVLKLGRQKSPYHHVVAGATYYRSVENFLNLTTEFLWRGPQNRPKRKIQIAITSKPEIDFVTIPTAFRNVTGGPKKSLKIFRQGRRKGSNSKMCHTPKNFKPQFIKICKIDFL